LPTHNHDAANITSGSLSLAGGVSGGNLAVGGTIVVEASRNIGNVANINHSGYIQSGGVGNFDGGLQIASGRKITAAGQVIIRYYAQNDTPTLNTDEIAVWWDTDGGAIYLVAEAGDDLDLPVLDAVRGQTPDQAHTGFAQAPFGHAPREEPVIDREGDAIWLAPRQRQ